ncbi:uncharacterized protein MELLADRAFT_108117 [Melampsora larici-populina 98AG31]|uniref:Uncharacterized protein n=1 Tax=Melampsora larici-populina (strain 98AG31 / pathotype 3-4-7) TaxID=747676 RepID=F4RS11_MELLP|nr:uncharacterized protein MELLADRAFT_108117 [Melampsora larici-populina 98AG31]EGG04859.1 hypothetical protein MELLADRAFT_108117 [Melampsora larici-populina 98AG31]
MTDCPSRSLSLRYDLAHPIIKPIHNAFDHIKDPFIKQLFMNYHTQKSGPNHCEEGEGILRFWSGIQSIIDQRRYQLLNTRWMISNKNQLHEATKMEHIRRGSEEDSDFVRCKL